MKPQFGRTKTRVGKKFLENRGSKVVENDKVALIVKGGKTSEIVTGSCLFLFFCYVKNKIDLTYCSTF
jgi:hypothetical protein